MDAFEVIEINNIKRVCSNHIYVSQAQTVLSNIQWLDHQLDYLLQLTGTDPVDELTGLEKTNIQKGRAIQEYYKSRVSQDGPHFRIRSKNPMQDFEYGIEKYSDEQLGVPEEPFTCTDFQLEDTTIRFIHPDSYRLCPQCTYHNHYTSSQCTMCSSLLTKSCTRREWECSMCKLINIPSAKVCDACGETNHETE